MQMKLCQTNRIIFSYYYLFSNITMATLISTLSTDVIGYIFSWLTPEELIRIARVCKYWKYVSEQDFLWANKVQEIVLPSTLKRNYLFQQSLSPVSSYTVYDANNTHELSKPNTVYMNMCRKTVLKLVRQEKYPYSVNNHASTLYCTSLAHKSIRTMTWIKTLDLSHLRLDSIPIEVTNMTWLEHLVLSYNVLVTIPDRIANLVNLVMLICRNNFIEKLPEALFTINRLTNIDLRNNCIEVIPHYIKYLTNLRTLNLSNNRIGYIPREIKYVTTLERLLLETNGIATIPDAVCSLPELRVLDLDNNKITYLYPPLIDKLERMPKIRDIYVSYEKLDGETIMELRKSKRRVIKMISHYD